jgi:phosphatidylinositol alpha 1,6-mannosyltransferase
MGLSPSGRPLRVALFTGNYNHILDGVSRTLNRVVDYLERQGIPVLVFGPTVDDPPVEHAGELVPVPSMALPGRADYRLSFGLSNSVRARLEVFAPTLVHIATPDVLGLQALRWARRSGLPIVSTYHTHFGSYLQYYWLLRRTERVVWSYVQWFYGQCHQLYVPSEVMIDELRSRGIETPMRVWARGVEVDRFKPQYRSLEWRRGHGISDEDVVVAFVGRLVREKGLHLFADVTRRLAEAGFPSRALIVGQGPAREEVEPMLPPNAVFTGHLEGDELAVAYASSDVFLFPSDTEAANNVTLEAMASGLATVCADAAGSQHLVRHGETGFLAKPQLADDFLRYTQQLVEDWPLRAQLGAAGRRYAEAYSWQAVLARLVDYYQDVLDRTDVAPAHATAYPLAPT